MRCSSSRYYSDEELVGTFEKLPKASFSNVPLDKTLGDHCFGDFYEARDVCAGNVVGLSGFRL